ncbi:MAG TPA: FAD-linked oxidase C-terminal domain-containing protein [Flavobacteriaceae bacterium]|nr:FAD-linked oxidase C-terminal domain-containing protein [Flavobacteriaceae bacterium]
MEHTTLADFEKSFQGRLHMDKLYQSMYATDASVYRKIPLAVAFPDSIQGIKQLIDFAHANHIGLIPRAGGTSLAGQCVGEGIVVDISKSFTEILHFDPEELSITIQPGVIRDELNRFLELYGVFFAPNTSTSNRCTIGGMVGNNSSGTTSIKYGVTRDKVIRLKGLLSDGTQVIFEPVTKEQFVEKMALTSLEGEIYRKICKLLSSKETQDEIEKEFPKPEIHRRNTGYAIDALLNSTVFDRSEELFNFCHLIAGSEGTLMFITEITLKLDPLLPKYTAVVAPHYDSLDACLKDVVISMNHDLYTCEMMDHVILDCTKNNKTYLPYRAFVKNNPKAILLLELRSDAQDDLEKQLKQVIQTLQLSKNAYHFPILRGDEIARALELRKAGLGLLGNMVGDKKAVACIEDTAVALTDLPEYIADFTQLMQKYNQNAVYYAHAGAGELHLRPILNLKNSDDVADFRKITTDVAKLCKKYKGSFSGEHGDGIVRAEFIPTMIGEKNYQIIREIKEVFDPKNIFNPGKIVDPFPMDRALRYEADREEPKIETLMNFDDYLGIHRLAENCNGSGDCRKTERSSGAMCPSYHATRDEKDTTRARANVLREVLTNNKAVNKFDSQELKEVMDLCLSCKACASECPSNVDIATAKAEFLFQYYKTHKPSVATRFFAHSSKIYALAAKYPHITNLAFNTKVTSKFIKKISRIHPRRSLPNVSIKRFNKRILNSDNQLLTVNDLDKAKSKTIYLLIDEFSRTMDVDIANDAVELLIKLGYHVIPILHLDSGRALISKGFLEQAKKEVDRNIRFLKEKVSHETPLLGIEPSAILSFRDEYLRLSTDRESATRIADNSFLIEEFLASEIEAGAIKRESFTSEKRKIKIHIHCHQKSLSNQKITFDVLNFPENYSPTIIPAGCCGMAGSFGMEKEHYDVSMKIGELILFPGIRKTTDDVILASNGTSCRHQILDGTGRIAKHPITILKEALRV